MEESSSGDEEEGSADSGSDDEHDARPYLALMKSFTKNSENGAKRRKLGHPEISEAQSSDQEVSSPEAGEERDLDLVEEAEEEPDEDLPGDVSDEDDEVDESDPFETHFAEPDEQGVAKRIKAIQGNEWTSTKDSHGTSRVVFTQPGVESDSKAPSVVFSGPSNLKLKERLHNVITSLRPEFDGIEQRVAPLLFQYFDTLFCDRSVANAENLRRLACLHAVNHVFKYELLLLQLWAILILP